VSGSGADVDGGGLRRWVVVGAVGVACGVLDGWVFYALTGSLFLGVLVGVPTAAILVVLGVVGARQRQGADRARAAYEARRARQRRALERAAGRIPPPPEG
jgi:hypothetical protein